MVGFTGTKDDPGSRAVMWDPINGLQNLNTLFAPELAAWSAAHGGVTLTLNAATAIGNDGSIAGIATDSLGHTKQGFLIMGGTRAVDFAVGGRWIGRPAGLCMEETEVTRTTSLSRKAERGRGCNHSLSLWERGRG